MNKILIDGATSPKSLWTKWKSKHGVENEFLCGNGMPVSIEISSIKVVSDSDLHHIQLRFQEQSSKIV